MDLSWPQGQGKGDMEALEWVGELGGARTPRFNRKLSHQAFYTICTCSCAAQWSPGPVLVFHRSQRAHICTMCVHWVGSCLGEGG